MISPNPPYYNKKELWSLFLVCAFPFLFWTLIMGFRDVSWLAERTNAWDAVGVIAYGMIFALIESIAFFVVTALLGFLVLRKWGSERRVALLGGLALITMLWAMVNQLYFLAGAAIPNLIVQFLVSTGRPLVAIYFLAAALVTISVIFPVYYILKSEEKLKIIQDFLERLSMLTMLYLFLVFVSLVIVVVRNIQGIYGG